MASQTITAPHLNVKLDYPHTQSNGQSVANVLELFFLRFDSGLHSSTSARKGVVVSLRNRVQETVVSATASLVVVAAPALLFGTPLLMGFTFGHRSTLIASC